jgi:tetratricopeptide (TPR) repeat protein
MNKLYLTIATVMFCAAAIAKTSKADRLFGQWEYFKAAQLYEQEAKIHPGADVYFKLGECYRKMHTYKKEEQAADDYVNAAGTYSKPEFYLNYGQVLKSNGRYSEAKAAFNKYSELMPSDPRGKFYSNSIDIIAADHLYDEPITVSNVTALNTKHADFSPVFYKDGIVFTTSRATPEHNRIFEWTGANYLDLYYAKIGSDESSFSDVTPFGGKHIDKKFSNGTACFSKDGNTIYI